MTAAEVFGIAELLDIILKECDERTMMNCQRVDKTFKHAIDGSHELQYKLFFTEQRPPSVSPASAAIEVNPLIASLLPKISHDESPRILLLERLFAPPKRASSPSYRPRFAEGSWTRMYLFRRAQKNEVYISFNEDKTSPFSTRVVASTSRRSDSILKTPILEWRARMSGIESLINGKVEEVKAGRRALWDQADFLNWVLGMVPRERMDIDEWLQRRDFSRIKDIATIYARDRAENHLAKTARKLAFDCAVEALEGRQGQHYGDVDEYVDKITAEPDLLTISNVQLRHRKWSIAARGSA